jgi:hypothetical protein
MLRLYLKLLKTSRHVPAAAKTIVILDGAYVVVGVETARMTANVKARNIVSIYSDSTVTTSATSSLVIARDGQHIFSRIISRRQKKLTVVVLFTITARQVLRKT